MFIAALFTIARTWKQPGCPSTDKWLKKLWYIYTMEYYSSIKRNIFESVLMTGWSLLKSDLLHFCSLRRRSSIQTAKTRPGVDCGSDHQLLIGKLRLKLKKVEKTTRPFKYDINQIP